MNSCHPIIWLRCKGGPRHGQIVTVNATVDGPRFRVAVLIEDGSWEYLNLLDQRVPVKIGLYEAEDTERGQRFVWKGFI